MYHTLAPTRTGQCTGPDAIHCLGKVLSFEISNTVLKRPLVPYNARIVGDWTSNTYVCSNSNVKHQMANAWPNNQPTSRPGSACGSTLKCSMSSIPAQDTTSGFSAQCRVNVLVGLQRTMTEFAPISCHNE